MRVASDRPGCSAERVILLLLMLLLLEQNRQTSLCPPEAYPVLEPFLDRCWVLMLLCGSSQQQQQQQQHCSTLSTAAAAAAGRLITGYALRGGGGSHQKPLKIAGSSSCCSHTVTVMYWKHDLTSQYNRLPVQQKGQKNSPKGHAWPLHHFRVAHRARRRGALKRAASTAQLAELSLPWQAGTSCHQTSCWRDCHAFKQLQARPDKSLSWMLEEGSKQAPVSRTSQPCLRLCCLLTAV
jgi:hypothetical protein